ncbi:MAG: peroxiredoxin [Candidatus Micrarchaeota archaeon]|nr:peroxiredoxin [Candidatus Micrarchaeota archaeon]MDE1847465.1 peroxiredoxin [Candidatus Micrarchaeota archaeon]MDE1864040.1 peroxiredoxin [Candidatus Micrarchaeota archaeon]
MGTDNQAHSLSDYRGKKVVLYFYPKDDTPGCTKEACDFRDSMESIREDGTEVLGVSMDTVMSHVKFTNKYNLNFMLLADMTGKVCEDYGVMGNKHIFGKSSWGLVRTTYVIDKGGRIVKVFSPVKVDGHRDEVVAELGKIS